MSIWREANFLKRFSDYFVKKNLFFGSLKIVEKKVKKDMDRVTLITPTFGITGSNWPRHCSVVRLGSQKDNLVPFF